MVRFSSIIVIVVMIMITIAVIKHDAIVASERIVRRHTIIVLVVVAALPSTRLRKIDVLRQPFVFSTQKVLISIHHGLWPPGDAGEGQQMGVAYPVLSGRSPNSETSTYGPLYKLFPTGPTMPIHFFVRHPASIASLS